MLDGRVRRSLPPSAADCTHGATRKVRPCNNRLDMTRNLDWLPTELDPVAMRIARADECAYAIGDMAGTWSLEGLELEAFRTGDRVTTRISAIRPIPPKISLLFSEAVNHLRAALDNVIWHLASTTQGAITGGAATMVSLPIYDKQKDLDRWRQARLNAGLTAFAPTTDLYLRIQALQPFADHASRIPNMNPFVAAHTGVTVEPAHPLKLLQGYSNDDKHRAIRVAVARTRATRVGEVLNEQRAFEELKVGDVVSEATWGERIDWELSTAVRIPRPAPYSSLVTPANEISRLATYVAHTAIPQLLTGLALSGSLPMQVDLADSGATDRARLVAGDPEAAEDRLRPLFDRRYFEAVDRPARFPKIVEPRPEEAGSK